MSVQQLVDGEVGSTGVDKRGYVDGAEKVSGFSGGQQRATAKKQNGDKLQQAEHLLQLVFIYSHQPRVVQAAHVMEALR